MKSLKKTALILSLMIILTACDGSISPLSPEVLSSQVIIAVTTLPAATVVLTANKLFVLSGTYQTIKDGKPITLKAGTGIDFNTYELFSFDVDKFVNLYKGDHPELVR